MPSGTEPFARVQFIDPQSNQVTYEIGSTNMHAFEWKSFINGGYSIRGTIVDPYFGILSRALGLSADEVTRNYLQNARRRPDTFLLKFRIGWEPGREVGDNTTRERLAILTDVNILGQSAYGGWEFVAIDPPNFCLNAGKGSGRVFKGRVSDVIRTVFNDYMADDSFTVEVTETSDNKDGRWPMMRQDPKTFMRSLLDWSSSLTPKKTNWIVASLDKKLIIKEHAELAQSGGKLIESYNGNWRGNPPSDIRSFAYISDNILTGINTRLITQGISAVTGRFLDATTDEETIVDDQRTANKVNVNVGSDRAFAKPDPNLEWGQSVFAIPEMNGGELGLKYEDYIDGRARYQYLNMLPQVMRVRVTVAGDVNFDDPTRFGVDCVHIKWADVESPEGFFLGGNWILYGFHHHMTREYFDTDLYLYRIDHDAAANTKINCQEQGDPRPGQAL